MKSNNAAGRTRWILALGTITLVVCSTWGCSGRTDKTANEVKMPVPKAVRPANPAMWAPPEAFDLKLWARGKVDTQFDYRVRDPYPAKKTLDGIKAHLRKGGWTALKENALNPGIPNSIVRGWSTFGAIQGPKEKTIRQWWTDWTNKHGECVTYMLQYETENGKMENVSEVSVVVWYYNAADFKRVLRETAEQRAQDAAKKAPPPR